MGLNHTRLSTRLLLGFGVLALMMAFIGGTWLFKTASLGEVLHTLTQARIPRVGALNEIKANVFQIGLSLRNMALLGDRAEIRQQAAQILALRDGHAAAQAKVLELFDAGQAEQAKTHPPAVARPALREYLGAVDALVRFQGELTQESAAEAARQIKCLITASVERVERGTTLVDQAGKAMDDVVSSIRHVCDIVGEISGASVEQSTGVQQVGDAVGQMDQVTQQNAALVEESAAAAESLRQQAAGLLASVSVFRLGDGAGAAPATAAP